MITTSVKPACTRMYSITPAQLRQMDVHKIYCACSPNASSNYYVHEYKNKDAALSDTKHDLIIWRQMLLDQNKKIAAYRDGSYLNRKMNEYREQLQKEIQKTLKEENEKLQKREKLIQLSQKSVYDIEKLPQDGKKVFIVQPIKENFSFPFEFGEWPDNIKYPN